MSICGKHNCTDCSECMKVATDLSVPGIPISLSKVGDVGTVVRISGKEEVKKFLNGLGFTPGSRVSTVSTAGGNVIVDLMGSKIAIDRHMASKIMVSPES